MALVYDKKLCCGTMSSGTREYKLYQGNACLIVVTETEDRDETGEPIAVHNLAGFFLDKEHMRRCLGLTKEYKTNGFAHITKLRINKKRNSDWKAIAIAFLEANDAITVEVYSEE